jgi:hypothetical protein
MIIIIILSHTNVVSTLSQLYLTYMVRLSNESVAEILPSIGISNNDEQIALLDRRSDGCHINRL